MSYRVYAAITALMLTAVVAWSQSPSQQTSAQQQEQGQTQKTNPQENKPPRQTNQSNQTDGRLSSADRDFVAEACAAGKAEVADGQLAVNRASNPAVKTFAQRMVDDHTRTNQDLLQLASIKGLTPQSGMTSRTASTPTGQAGQIPAAAQTAGEQVTEQPAQSKAKALDMMNKWSKLSGTDFDREYMKAQIQNHEKAVFLFETEANSGSDPDLKTFAEKALPALRDHLKMARDVAYKVGASETRSAAR
jgi:putative membrane protein